MITRLQLSLSELKPEVYQAEYKPELGFTLGLPGVISAGLGALDNAKALPDELKARLVQWLLQQRDNGYWLSTYDTAQVIYNTRQLLSQEAALTHSAKPRTITVSTGNKTALGKLAAIPGGYLAEFTDLTPAQDLSHLLVSDTLPTDTITANLNVGVPYTAVQAKSANLTITRSYRRITASGSEAIDLSQQALHVGDTMVSEISVKRSSNEANNTAHPASDFVVISDAIPAIAEGLENDKTYLADANIQSKDDDYWQHVKETQRYPDKVLRVVKLLSAAEMKFYQVFRVARAGRAVLAPATAFDMYQEAEQANSVAQVISVD
ncbi:hypothetical protein [Methylocucumis oryzae]|uniref:alpha-2-macroglobulin family protein n=1 Tax=Methylocucumis oryzae TaxID=1632867 RepID=UPI000698A744|nr:hypothetical protein [Methylocucumis oryzae]